MKTKLDLGFYVLDLIAGSPEGGELLKAKFAEMLPTMTPEERAELNKPLSEAAFQHCVADFLRDPPAFREWVLNEWRLLPRRQPGNSTADGDFLIWKPKHKPNKRKHGGARRSDGKQTPRSARKHK